MTDHGFPRPPRGAVAPPEIVAAIEGLHAATRAAIDAAYASDPDNVWLPIGYPYAHDLEEIGARVLNWLEAIATYGQDEDEDEDEDEGEGDPPLFAAYVADELTRGGMPAAGSARVAAGQLEGPAGDPASSSEARDEDV